ncbi:MAG: NAD(P) transhydrogenase subunit beta [Chitinophagaceae bacterium]|nr:MAG: NAD(P) transhydrogenase subunit beta [Chitinophagaceae bacterium]
MELNLLTLCYLIGSITFIIGLKMLSHPESARKGNLIAAAGMTISIFGTIFLYQEEGVFLHNYAWIFSALIIGTIIGTIAAKKVKMTSMPELVSLFNGMGGACAALISIIEFQHIENNMLNNANAATADTATLLSVFAGLVIGSVSFAGS